MTTYINVNETLSDVRLADMWLSIRRKEIVLKLPTGEWIELI